MLRKKLIGLAAAVALGCVPVATNALAAGHPSGGRGGHASASAARGGYAMAGHAHRGRVVQYGGGYGGGYVNGPIYDSCAGYGYGYGYGYNGCLLATAPLPLSTA